ncbi:CotH kinase family protein, partial [Flavobacterium sp.]|uniref:CotH kinase family protein n=1 Tax=Flavobacterium sp. TaxID=239 RepID=UPI0037C1A76D
MRNIILLCLFSFGFLNAQNYPSEIHFSTDGRIMYTGGLTPNSGFYNKDSIKNVYLNFPQANYWMLLTNNYATETNIPASLVYDGITYDSVGVRFRGNTSYTTLGTSQKKSFSVETDFIDTNQTLLGYNNLKFNNGHQDASFMREVLYCRMAGRHTPIAKANYVHLFLNNQDWGLYPNIQSIDKNFLEQWFLSNDGARFRATVDGTGGGGGGGGPSWGDGTAAMNYLGANQASYQSYYTLKSNDVIIDPWQSLVEACFDLSTATTANMDSISSVIDVDRVLWHLAVENIFTDDDSYIMKGKMDYMVYIEPETGRTFTLEYDGNSSFQSSQATSTNWGPFKNVANANYPLLNKLLNIPEWRQRYLAHYRTILNETFTTANATLLVNDFNSKIAALVASDPKKLYSTAQYNSNYPTLISFVTNRRNYLMSNSEVAQIAPIISAAPFYNSSMLQYAEPVSGEAVNIKASINSSSGIFGVTLYYGTGVMGTFNEVTMFDDGNHNDDAAGDGIFGAQIPGFPATTLVRYYIEAKANNASKSASFLPAGAEHDVFVYTVKSQLTPNGVVINEIMASNATSAQDETGAFADWVELYNNNATPIDLSGFYLSDDSTNAAKWQFPAGTIIGANGYLILWADEDILDGPLH